MDCAVAVCKNYYKKTKGVQESFQEDICHNQRSTKCYVLLDRFAKENEMPLPSNEEELKQQCVYFDEVFDCVHNYSVRCMADLQYDLYLFSASSTVAKMKELCNPDHETHKSYLKNAPCIVKHYGGTATCIRTYLAAFEIIRETKPEDKLKMFCCATNKYRDCIFEHYRTKCNEDVVNLIGILTEFPFFELVVQTCDSFKSYSPKCPILPAADDMKDAYKNHMIGVLLQTFLKD